MKAHILAPAVILILSGCVTAVSEKSPSAIVESMASYQEAYRRADAFSRTCHSDGNPLAGYFVVSGNLYTDTQTGVVRVQHTTYAKDFLRVEIAATPSGSTSTIRVAGVGIWDQKEIDALTETLKSGQIRCRS
ncbi:BPTD_2524 family lipoprotein [Achromobacter aegrifaciens]|uniref:BPTD_2524 family lipoprotein n=1 Tax=Achromobacter aegrifaciens TaxID=1287736 RepID=UPI000F7396F7|nr:hypothetical protein [Achromobacter aegrifaciens]